MMSDPNDNRDETVPASTERPYLLAQGRSWRFELRDAILRCHAANVIGSVVIRDDSTPPAKPNSGPAAPIDFDAFE